MPIVRSTVARATFVALLTAITGCDKAPTPAPSIVPDVLMIDAACAPVANGCDLGVESERTFSAMVVSGEGGREAAEAQWASDDATVASVDGSGRVRGIRSGVATISAQVGSLTAKVPVAIVARRLGYWKGEFIIRRCVASGNFNSAEWCGTGSQRAGTRGDFALDLRKDRRLVGGVVIDR